MKYQILLADDEVTFRETFTKVLQEEGMDVTAVSNGTDAIDAVTKNSYDVVILDIQMPGANGIKVLRETMKVRPQTRVIMITAYGTQDRMDACQKLGVSGFFAKEENFDSLLNIIDTVLKLHKGLKK